MSYDLSALKFNVDTSSLKDAITMVGQLATSVSDLNKPLKTMGDATKVTTTEVDKTTKAVDTNTKAVKTNQSILEKQEAILGKMGEGWSKGQASILAAAAAAGAANTEMKKLESTLSSQRRLVGNDPFDKSASGLISLTQGLGQAREGYRQMLAFEKEFTRLKAEGNGAELRLVGLNRKETDSLYRDKQRMIEQYKMLKAAQFDASETQMIEKQKNAYKDLIQNVKNLENTYKEVATAKRPLDNIRTVDATKRRDQLNYMARGTSVQLGDIAVSLAGGQNPLTVFMQQGDQLRGILGHVATDAKEMQTVMNNAFKQIITGFIGVTQALGTFAIGALKTTGEAVVGFAMKFTGLNAMMDLARHGLEKLDYNLGTNFVKSFDAAGSSMAGFGTAIRTLAAVGVVAAIASLVMLGFAFKNILSVNHDLTAALGASGAALAVTNKEAMQMSTALASSSANSMDVAKVLTEMALAGNLGKESIVNVTKAATDMNRYLGVATADTVAAYSKLAADPVKALTEVGLATGSLTAATIDNIRELEEQGKHAQAVALAMVELDRIHGERVQSMKDNMTPLGKLWDDMRQSMKSLTEETYRFAQSDGMIKTLTGVWNYLASRLNVVVYLMKQAKELAASLPSLGEIVKDPLQAGASTADRSSSAMAKNSEEFNKTQAELLGFSKPVEGVNTAEQATKSYITTMQAGIATRRLMTKEEEKAANAKGIQANQETEDAKKLYGANSRLSEARRAEEIAKEKSKQDSRTGRQVSDAIRTSVQTPEGQEELKKRLAELQKTKEDIYFGIEEKYKPKKEAKGAKPNLNDGIDARVKQIENERTASERAAKAGVELLDSLHGRELVNDTDFINQKAAIQATALSNSLDFLKREQAIAKEKVNGLKEYQAFEGKIKKTEDDIKEQELKRSYAILDLNDKIAKDSLKKSIDELTQLQEKNKASTLEIETIGLDDKALQSLLLARENHTISLLEENMAYKQRNGYSESNVKTMAVEIETIKALKTARDLGVEKKTKTDFTSLEAKLLPTKPVYSDGEGERIIGEESKKQAAYNATARVQIDAEIAVATVKFNNRRLTEGVTPKEIEDFDKLLVKANEMKTVLGTQMTLAIKIDGLDQISAAFSSLSTIVGNFGSMAQTNVDNITASIGRMGDSYKGQFSGMLKEAQASAAGYGRLQKSISGISGSLKTLSEAEKKGAEGSKERTMAQVGGYAEMAGAAADYFEKGSTGYGVLKAAEQGFRAFEMAMSIQSVAQNAVEAASKIAKNQGVALSGVMAGAAEFFAELGPFAFPAIAAMLGVMASLGFGGGGSSGSSGSFGTLGAGNSIGADGRSSKAGAGEDMNVGSNYNPASGRYDLNNQPQLTAAEVKSRADAAAIDAAVNAVNNLKVEAMKLTKGSEELEKSLMRARIAAGGAGIAQHELATKGMNEAELASYNYSQALKAQTSVQMDIANGTEVTSENMKKLAGESRSLAIELATASGDIAGARAMKRQDDTAGYTAAEVAVYDHNNAMRDQIDAMNAGASAAREAAQAEQELANKRYELAGRLNVLLGRQTQLEFDRATELAGTTDAASLAMLGLIYQMEDLNSAVDAAYAVMERSFAYTEKAITSERKIAETRLKGATDLQSLLKGAVDATTPETARVVAQAQLKGFLALARSSGALPDAEFLKPTLTALTRSSIDSFKSDIEYRRDQALTANDIIELAGFANAQVTLGQQNIDRLDAQLEIAKQQLDTAKAQLDALRGVDTSVKDLALALSGFQGAVSNLTSAKSSAGSYSYAAPSPSSGGGGGGSYGGGSSSSSAAAEYESIAGQDNKDIVAAYRAYYNRNPDPTGYKGFVESRLTGDKLMQAILGASAANPDGDDYKTAFSKGYDPTNPTIKFLKSLQTSTAAVFEDYGGSFAVGSNYIPNDMLAQIHKGERILPAADNAELFSRLNNPERNAEVLAAAVERLTREVEGLRIEQRQTVSNTKATEKLLSRLSNDGESLNVTVAT